ncbi:hypothetical protein [Streptomyces scabiei]|nr:hypothetical protein [Streptomyces scabiei]
MTQTTGLAIGTLHLAGRTDIAASFRHHSGDPTYLLTTPGIM